MKIQLVSDIHLEFGHTVNIDNAGADVLVLAGDIACARNFENYKDFFKSCADKFPHVIYIMGNHEHYKHTFNDTAQVIREGLAHLNNIHFLDKACIDIDGIHFIGTTLWTDFNKRCPITENQLQFGMNDYRVIKYRDDAGNYFRLTPKAIYHEHRLSIDLIEAESAMINPDTPCVVVTHHAPSFQSVSPIYQNDTYMNGGYASNLDHMMTDNIKLWCHGHMHNNSDYLIGNTRVVCNPLGYPGERRNPDTNFTVEV